MIRKLLDDGTDLVGAMEQVLNFLENVQGSGERLPADCVDLAVTLIRMYSEPDPIGLPAWIERERARRLAGRFARDRILGSHFGPSKKSRRLPPPKPEPAPEPVPASLAVTLFDLVKTFEQVLDKVKQSGVAK